MTVYLIEYFATYLYGQYELQRMRETRTGLYEPQTVKYSRMGATPAAPPGLGKNIYALKIFVPQKIKTDLQALADTTKITLGEYLRALICAHLFGQEFGVRQAFEIALIEEQAASRWEGFMDAGVSDDSR